MVSKLRAITDVAVGEGDYCFGEISFSVDKIDILSERGPTGLTESR